MLLILLASFSWKKVFCCLRVWMCEPCSFYMKRLFFVCFREYSVFWYFNRSFLFCIFIQFDNKNITYYELKPNVGKQVDLFILWFWILISLFDTLWILNWTQFVFILGFNTNLGIWIKSMRNKKISQVTKLK